MKKSALIALMVIGSARAQASWYQVRCKNADETVQLNSGHSENSIILTFKRQDGRKITLELGPEFIFQLSEKTVVSDVNETKCLPGSQTGVWMRRESAPKRSRSLAWMAQRLQMRASDTIQISAKIGNRSKLI